MRNEYRVFNEIARKYDILRIRMKISYMAFENCITIQELFLRAIFKTLLDKHKHPSFIPKDIHLENDLFYKRVISGELTMKRLVEEKKDNDKDGKDTTKISEPISPGINVTSLGGN